MIAPCKTSGMPFDFDDSWPTPDYRSKLVDHLNLSGFRSCNRLRIFQETPLIFFFDGCVTSIRLNILTFHPKKSIPLSHA